MGNLSVYWEDQIDSYYFHLVINNTFTDNVYGAVGFSFDPFMGNDSIDACRFSSISNMSVIEAYYSTVKTRPTILNATNPSHGLFNGSISISNGVFTCSFNRFKSMPNTPLFYDLNNSSYFILLATGITNITSKY